MSISLIKGQKVDLTKNNPHLSVLKVGLGWDPMRGRSMDIDASALLLNENGKLTQTKNLVYFGNKNSPCGAVVHSGDNLTGHGDGDDEVITVSLQQLPPEVHRVVFIVNIFRFFSFGRRKDFSMVNNAYIRVLDASQDEEILRYNLTEDYKGMCSIRVGEVYRYGGEWKFGAIGEGSTITSLNELVKTYE
ncbi:TerD family protein [Paenibacillus sp. P2(2022)]|uniref:TerD family protein n=1 Tax=Paenibacillus TaxID=44249 RepID=UPI00042E63E2|nr:MULTISPECIES: TerD family protein [Paenibacillus]MCV9948562.1 TerD family protein [Paenibacillus sp. BT-177]MEB4782815.1 TerD family protein [Paenibacillus jamilae]AHM67209.1 stress protein [Paenibacillus polymyxa SQR-21]AIY08001.1 stress protein [Paenibacillus polymyxa]MDG0052332.1 TerD family protein [Paenibacillus sp. P2(2022)]